MSQGHTKYQQEKIHSELRDHPHVIQNTSSDALTQTHGTGNAATNGPSSSFQTPAVTGQAVPSTPHTRRVGDPSPVPFFRSSNQHLPVLGAVRSSSLQTCQMGHGQSKATPLQSSLPSQSSISGANLLLDAGLPTTKGFNVTGRKLKRPFVAKRKDSEDSYTLAYKETTGETITASKSSSPLSPAEYAPDSMDSLKSSHQEPVSNAPPSQVLAKNLVTSVSNPLPMSKPSASSSGYPEPSERSSTTSGPSRKHPKSSTLEPPATVGNRNSVIALSPGISSAINFMMMEWQEPSKPQLTLDTSSTAVSILPSLPSAGADFSKANKDNDIRKEKESLRRHSGGPAPTSPDKREMKESWRKSDSTNSHHTVRANSLRASRPVSWAESFHSAYTIVPANGGSTAPQGPSTRRLSGLIADMDFGVREEELEEDIDANPDGSLPLLPHPVATFNSIQDPDKDGNLGLPTPDLDPPPVPHKKSTDLFKKAKRRSISLSSALPGPVVGLLGAKAPQSELPIATTMPTPAPSALEVRKVPHSIPGIDGFRNASLPHVHTHFQQQSENMHQRPPLPADVSHHVPSMAFSTSQLTSGSRATQDNTSLQQSSAASNLKAKLQTFLPPLPRNEHGVSSIPPDPLNSLADAFTQTHPSATPVSYSSHLRQPTISGLGPSAAGIAKRAVERMSRRLGDMMNGFSPSSNGSISGHSSSTSISTTASTSLTSGTSFVPLADSHIQVHAEYVPGRTPSRGSIPASPSGHAHHHSMIQAFLAGPSKSGGHKRLQKSLGSPAAMGDFVAGGGSSSALSSASTSASTSESDPFSPTGPILGQRLRGPLKKGTIFGKELKTAVKETKVVMKENDGITDAVEGRKEGLIKALEHRVLPAVVVRCAQHLLIWGVQEEGLFRVNGRPRHVSQLRAEFDSGADYDMTECSPSELDPHAVASVFKAYLRELPDSILTHKLQPYFDAAITRETTVHTQEQQWKSPQPSIKTRQGLPSGPRNSIAPTSLYRPPSLSTLAMPSFNQVPPPSKSLVYALRSLIAQLPPENRDLIWTVVDLIKATAKGSKATKMPLSNLLLLFCPSLNMSPPLLRILCEAEGIWEEERVVYISRELVEDDCVVESDAEPPVLISSRHHTSTPHDEDETGGFDEESSLRSGRASLDKPSSLDYHASAEEDSLFSEERVAIRGRKIPERAEIPTVYLDTRSHLSSSSISLLQDATEGHTGYLVRGEMRDDGSISSGVYSFKNPPTSPSPPPLSSSAGSVSTPTSSANPSFANLPLDGGKDPEQHKRSEPDLRSASARASPQIVGSEPGEIRKKPFISNPIPITGLSPAQYPFPSSRGRELAPTTPSRRRSIPLLSLSSFSSRSSGSPSASPSNKDGSYLTESRSKKPSLKLLFSKKSTSSLFEKERPVISLPMLLPPEPHFQHERASIRSGSGSDSSISTPLSAVTAPQGSSSLCLLASTNEGPPVLNTLIEDSSLKFDELMNKDSTKSIMDTPSSHLTGLSPRPVSALPSRSLSGDSMSRPKAPPSNVPAKLDTQPSLSSRLPPSYPTDEDWMRSVLVAADVAHSKNL